MNSIAWCEKGREHVGSPDPQRGARKEIKGLQRGKRYGSHTGWALRASETIGWETNQESSKGDWGVEEPATERM